MSAGQRLSRAGLALAGLALVVAGLTGIARAPGAARDTGVTAGATARLGPITVSASALRAGPRRTLTAALRVATTGPRPDQLDAAIAADGAPAAVYHQVISLVDLPDDVASCGGAVPPGGVVQRWMHYGPLTVPAKSGAAAILTVRQAAPATAGTVTVTLYFATAGPVTLRLPVS